MTPQVDDDALVAPAWSIWIGVPIGMAAALIFAIRGGHAGGVLLSICATLTWTFAVAVRALKIRRRNDPPSTWRIFVVMAFIFPAGFVAFAVPDQYRLLRLTRMLAAEILAMAIAALVLKAVRVLINRRPLGDR